jgi:serine/threonine-protein kinase
LVRALHHVEVMSDPCPLPLTPLLEMGSTLAEKYRIERLIAEGGMGIVYEGYHVVLEQRVAVKVVRPEYAHHPEAVERFLNEARAIARLRGHHIAKVLDTGRTDSGAPYMVLEYLEGRDLRTALDTDGPLPVDRAVEYLLQTCEAVAEAHAVGLIHRDLKPDNLFITRSADGREVLKVIDFGISKRVDGSGRCLTKQGQSLGSPHYMAPEQMASPEQVDARADIWSLGVVLYELLTNTVPFMGDSLAAACLQVLTAEPRSIRETRPEVPPALEQVVMRCLAKQRDDRYSSVQELAFELCAFLPELGPRSDTRLRAAASSMLESGSLAALGEARTLMSFSESTRSARRAELSDQLPIPRFRRRTLAVSAAAAALIAWGGVQAHLARAPEPVAAVAAPRGLLEREPVRPQDAQIPSETAIDVTTPVHPEGAPANAGTPTQRPLRTTVAPAPGKPAPAKPFKPPAPVQRATAQPPAPKLTTSRLSLPAPAPQPGALNAPQAADPAELVNPYPDLTPSKKSSRELGKP